MCNKRSIKIDKFQQKKGLQHHQVSIFKKQTAQLMNEVENSGCFQVYVHEKTKCQLLSGGFAGCRGNLDLSP